MTRVAPVVPAEGDLLCEGCGYALTGLDERSNCPECGRTIASSIGSGRRPPDWELDPPPGGKLVAFWRTTGCVLFRPTDFYRTIRTRGDERRALRFGRLHAVLAALLFGIAGSVHLSLFHPGFAADWWDIDDLSAGPAGTVILAAAAYLTLYLTVRVAARLTTWEATYRGLRLPLGVVRRGMAYNAAHYPLVALLTLLTVAGYAYLLRTERVAATTITTYLYVLCGEVVVFAAYLFNIYWIAMRNMLYANR
jgi:hypothetical protein